MSNSPSPGLDATHDPLRRSWVPSAQSEECDFTIQNLPYGRFRRAGSSQPWRIGVAIGSQILDMAAARAARGWPEALAPLLDALAAGDLKPVMAAPKARRQALRQALSDALAEGSPQQATLAAALVTQAQAEMSLPCAVGDYTDFYTGIHHATTVGKLFRPDNPLLPNYKWVPIGYHGRASSIVASGTPVRRPVGQTMAPGAAAPTVGPCQRLDYELELGLLVGKSNTLGEPVTIDQAEDHLFGMVLLNDWSARDLQAWEYQPLGPFLAKSFASSISPWVVTMEALAPYRQPFTRPADDPQPLPYLDSETNRAQGAVDLHLSAWLQTAQMREQDQAPVPLGQSNLLQAYWTPAQLLTHHTSNGCNLQTGDLLGTGTIAGPGTGEGGSLLELSMGGKNPVTLPNGEQRRFLEDGDTLVLRAFAQREGSARIGFGDCAGLIQPAR